MPASKYTQAQRDEALALYRTQGPSAAGKQLGIPKETIMSWAKRSGVHTVRNSRTREATEAKVVDAQARIAALRLVHIGIAESRADMLAAVQAGQEKYRTVLKGMGGSEDVRALDFIPPNDFRSEMNAAGSTAGTIKNLAPRETENNEAAISMIDKVIEGLGMGPEVTVEASAEPETD